MHILKVVQQLFFQPATGTLVSHFASSCVLILRLFVISQVDAVSVLGTLSEDKAVVPDACRAPEPLESAQDRERDNQVHNRGGGGGFTEDGILSKALQSLAITAQGLTDIWTTYCPSPLLELIPDILRSVCFCWL